MHTGHGDRERAVNARVDHHPVVIHRHQNIAQNGSRPRPDRPHALRRLGPRTDPQGPLTEFAPPSLNNRSGYIRVRSGNVQMGEARLARHSNDIAGQSGALGKVDAPIGTGIDHAVVGGQNDARAGRHAARKLSHGGVKTLELLEPLHGSPAVGVSGVVKLPDVEVDQADALPKRLNSEPGAGFETIRTPMGSTAQAGGGQARTDEARGADRHGQWRATLALGMGMTLIALKPFEDGGDVLPAPRIGSVSLPCDEAQILLRMRSRALGHVPAQQRVEYGVSDHAGDAGKSAGAQRRQCSGRR